MPTRVEKAIRQKRNRRGIFVPLIEDYYGRGYELSKEDGDYVRDVIRMGAMREENRIEEALFSPSSLGECLRKVYLSRHAHDLGIERVWQVRPDLSQYFLDGTFTHLKIQMIFHHLQQDGKIHSLEVEKRAMSKHGDHGGTVDIFVGIADDLHIVDVKAMNTNYFNKAVNGEISDKYRIQLADYLMLARADWKLPIKSAILLAENKGGPDDRHPAALTEVEVTSRDIPVVRKRLEVLRDHEAKKEIPEPECKTTTCTQFRYCPFKNYCKKEVQSIERKRKRKSPSRNATKYKVAVPKKRRARSPS